ncbi:recombinase family protein, partial [Cetobacterium sp.]|uniref:recombinase family protein n=1 Tax=Cetobacterium sp. TaxID=2071632 RepID=UPI003F373913
MRKALIYCRVSTVMQENGESLFYQIEKCKDFCKSKGMEIYKVLEDVESGAVDDREGFLKLQEEIKKKKFDVLVVYESSRISRRTLTMLNFILELEKNDIKFISISQPELDTTTPTGKLFFQIQSSLGEYERVQISTRVKSSKLQRAKSGKFQGGNLPLGYTRSNGKIIIDDNTREEVLNIFLSYVDLKSLSKVSKIFQRPVASIKWILENTFYLGKIPYGRKENNINTGIVKVN